MTNCAKCGLHGQPQVPWQWPRNPQLRILLVGQAPGGVESITKRPFTGPAGKMLWRLLKEAGLDKDRLWITNVVCCAPPQDRKPTPSEVECCLPRLIEEIHTAKPQLIVALGDVASNTLIGKANIRSLAGQFFDLLPLFNYECKVLCCLHPSFVMRQRQWIATAVAHFNKARDWFFTGQIVVTDQPEFIYDPSPSKLAWQLEQWAEQLTSFDIETPGELNPRRAEVIAISFCGERNKAVALDLHKGHPAWPIIQRYLEDPQAPKCAQNASFDVACLETEGVQVQGLAFDTRLAEHTLASGLPTSLDFLRGKYTDIPPYKPKRSEKESIDKWSKEERLRYSCLDALVTWRVAQAQQKLMDNDAWKVHNVILLPLVPVINKMERKGVLVDTKTLALLHKRIQPELERIQREVFTPLGVNPASPKQLKQLLGLDSTEEDELVKAIRQGHPKASLIEELLRYRKLAKVDSVYLLGVYHRLENGRIHTHFKIEGTETGRLSSQDPNLQNVPNEMRVIYVADPGKAIVEADYNQLELRVLAVVAQEQTAINELFYEGKNTHHVVGRAIYHRDWDQLTSDEKLRAKSVVFGTAYGRSARSIAMEFGISTLEAERWQALCINRYPGFLAYRQRQELVFNRGEPVRTPFGRKRVVSSLTQAFNTPIQSAAADVTLTSLIELDKAGIDLRLTVHDSIVAEFASHEVQEGVALMRRIMERPIEQLGGFSFPAKIKTGPNWANVEEVKL